MQLGDEPARVLLDKMVEQLRAQHHVDAVVRKGSPKRITCDDPSTSRERRGAETPCIESDGGERDAGIHGFRRAGPE